MRWPRFSKQKGDVMKAASAADTWASRLQEVLSPSEGKFWSSLPDGRIHLTPMGGGFADSRYFPPR